MNMVAVAVLVRVVGVLVLDVPLRPFTPRGSCRARGARADDREMTEARLEAVTISDAFADGIQLLDGQRPDGSATIAVQVLALAPSEQRIQPRAVAEMDVAHEAVALQGLEVAMDGGGVEVRPAGDVLGRYRPVRGEQRLEDQAPRGGQP